MSIEIKLPDLGDGIDSGTVSSVFVKAGDTIEKDQALVELETDKAVIEVPADAAGTIKKVLVAPGDEVKIGQALVELDAADTPTSKAETPAPVAPQPDAVEETTVTQTPPATGPVTQPLVVPDMGDGVDSGTVSTVFIKPGDTIEAEAPLVELETDKAVIEVPAAQGGTVVEVLVKEGDTLKPGQEICTIQTTAAEAPATAPETASPVAFADADTSHIDMESIRQREKDAVALVKRQAQRDPSKIAPAAPSVRRFAREIGVDIHEVPGTGPGGRISVEDVKAYSKLLHTQRRAGTATGTIAAEPLPDFSKFGPIETETMNKLRQTSARHLSTAWATIPHVTQFDKADITELEKLRKAHGKKAEAAGGKLTMTAILIKVVEAALRKFPQFNASIDMAKNEIIYKKYFNIGIAVDTERGLLVPVIRDVDKKNIIDLAVELTEISVKARAKKLTVEDMQGGNFSISNLGGIGGTGFTPIVNAPEVAILGVSRSEIQPRYIDGAFQPRLIMPLALSYDHRIIDGADAARFLRWICQVLEEPFTVLLEG